MKKHLQELKNLLVEIQKDKNGNVLKEVQSQSQKINLSELAEEILMESDYSYYNNKFQSVRDELGVPNEGAWRKQRGENLGDYKDRIDKADYRLASLKGYIKVELKKAWEDLLMIEGIKNLDDDSKKEVVMALGGKLESIVKEILKTLSVYPFEWDFEVDNLNNAISKLK